MADMYNHNCCQDVLDTVKIRLSEFPGRCTSVELVKFIVPEGVEVMRLLAGLVQVYMEYQDFHWFRLHDNFTVGSDARKYRHLKQMWKDMMFLKNDVGYVLDCTIPHSHELCDFDVQQAAFAIVDEDDFTMFADCFGSI